jgi:hypothetical protein
VRRQSGFEAIAPVNTAALHNTTGADIEIMRIAHIQKYVGSASAWVVRPPPLIASFWQPSTKARAAATTARNLNRPWCDQSTVGLRTVSVRQSPEKKDVTCLRVRVEIMGLIIPPY